MSVKQQLSDLALRVLGLEQNDEQRIIDSLKIAEETKSYNEKNDDRIQALEDGLAELKALNAEVKLASIPILLIQTEILSAELVPKDGVT